MKKADDGPRMEDDPPPNPASKRSFENGSSSLPKATKWDVDSKLNAVVEDFLLNHFEIEGQINGKTKELLVRFGGEVHKHIVEKESINAVAELQKSMKEGFETVLGQLKNLNKRQPDYVAKPHEKLSRPTFADTVKGYAATVLKGDTSTEPEKMEAVIRKEAEFGCYTILQADEKHIPCKELADDWTEVISRRQKKEKIKIVRLRQTNNNKVAIGFSDAGEQRKFEETIGREPIKGAVIRSSAERKVHFAIRGVPAEYTAERLERDLPFYNERHPYIMAEQLSIKDARQIEDNHIDDRRFKTFKLTVSTKHAKLLLDNDAFYLDIRRVRATLWKPSTRCTKCLKTGHYARDCEDLVCKHCSGDHISYRCPNMRSKASYNCAVCRRAGHRNIQHRANTEECSILKLEAAEETNKVLASITINHG